MDADQHASVQTQGSRHALDVALDCFVDAGAFPDHRHLPDEILGSFQKTFYIKL
jgi:hypothetical protein